MKTLNYKNVIIVAKNDCALIVNKDRKVVPVMNSTDNTVASLTAMKAFLEKVPANNDELVEEPYQLILGEKSSIKGFATGTHLQYIRTGANATGKAFTDEQFELIKEVSMLLAERSLNIRITTDKFISYQDKTTRALIDFAWKTLDKELAKAKTAPANKPARPTKPATAPVDPRVAKLQELMTKALDEGDFDKYDQLEERLNRLQAPVAPVEETNEVEVPEEEVQEETIEDPTAGSDEIDL